ncbi:CBS domain-containing protein [Sorangium sp. So ce131]|uniref:CBS domain-containing protein n=1 Tax=Sorangium sp. So ce131 TaxID=3133282 RepID=UPI003F626243
MSLSRFEHGAVSAELTESVTDVARRMREFRVGCVVVTHGARAIGIVTDRDLVLRVMAEARDPATTVVSDVVTYDPTTLQQTDSIETALRLMRERGVRRLPIVRHDGKVTGIVTADDLTVMLAAELSDLGAGIRGNVEATESR